MDAQAYTLGRDTGGGNCSAQRDDTGGGSAAGGYLQNDTGVGSAQRDNTGGGSAAGQSNTSGGSAQRDFTGGGSAQRDNTGGGSAQRDSTGGGSADATAAEAEEAVVIYLQTHDPIAWAVCRKPLRRNAARALIRVAHLVCADGSIYILSP